MLHVQNQGCREATDSNVGEHIDLCQRVNLWLLYVREALITDRVSLHDPRAEGPDLQFRRQWSKAWDWCNGGGRGLLYSVEPELTSEHLHPHIHVFLGEGFSSHQCLLQTVTPKFWGEKKSSIMLGERLDFPSLSLEKILLKGMKR